MNTHKFKVGDRVELARDALIRKTSVYEVQALLPEEQDGWQYRIQDPLTNQQRVVVESRLSAAE